MAEKETKTNSGPEQPAKDEGKTEGEGKENKSQGKDLTSPEAILMLSVAGIIDIISLIPAINWMSTVLGILVIGGWMVITRPGQALKRAAFRFLVVFGIELVPFVSIIPGWTGFVYMTLKSD